jgi:cation diffusion facilitator CzcD-associated flavoprotein CzcO
MTKKNPPRVAIVGAGLGGIAMAVNLKRAGITSFTVFDKLDGPGGVWWANTYPGCEVDVESHAYSFSFMPYDWSRSHAGQPELRQYAQDVLDKFALGENFRFGACVTRAQWDEARAGYTITLDDGEELEFDVLISATGLLSDPRIPSWPGMAGFTGPIFHTSRYEHQHDLTGRRVAVVGTGSTACQLAPALAASVGHLDVYQREPGWIMPKKVKDFDDGERQRFRTSMLARRRERLKAFRAARQNIEAFQVDSDRQKMLQQFGLHNLKKSVADPVVRDALTPRYAWGCKRPILANGFYKIFNRENVTLVPHSVTRVTETGLVDDAGAERPADVIILATGYCATNFLGTIDVTGPGGRRLADHWNGEPTAFLGITVPEYPNLFIMFGPNTNGGWSVIAQLERQAEVIARAVRGLRGGREVIETRAGLATRYDRWVQKRIATELSVLGTGCTNYYVTPSGKNVTQWPGTHTRYLLVTRALAPFGWRKRSVRAKSSAEVPRFCAPTGQTHTANQPVL